MIPNPSASEVAGLVGVARGVSDAPLGVGFLMPFVSREAVVAAAGLVEVVEFFFGGPDSDLVGCAKRGGAVVGWQVGSVGEARAAVVAGCDYVVAQGVEAGGHVRGTQPLEQVLLEVLSAVEVPVVAAGGIGSADRVSDVLALGASAVRVGTRFVAATESDAHPRYVELLVAAGREDTMVTEAFGVGWPNAPHRVLRSAIDAAQQFPSDGVVATVGDRRLPPFAPVPPIIEAQGAIDAMALYAGLSVSNVVERQPAAEIVAELTATLAS
jgi:NAD(P)H-dependent flavin oxidoreductase YrpB (nitropropane dioxygenase family)